MRRRDLLAMLGGAATVGIRPHVLYAQSSDRPRTIAVFLGNARDATDPAAQRLLAPFREALSEAGWVEGKTVHVEYYFTAGEPERFDAVAAEIVALRPDLIYALNLRSVTAVQSRTSTIPIVFSQVVDPIGAGLVASFVRPGGNITGFISNEIETAGKWVQFLKEISPKVDHIGALFNPDLAPYAMSFIAAAERAIGSTPSIIRCPVREARDIDEAAQELDRQGQGGFWVIPDPFTSVHIEDIIAEAARLRLPAIYAFPGATSAGGLMSYAEDFRAQMRPLASYISRILNGVSPAVLPVQTPSKYVLAINLTTVKALGLTIPPSLFARAEVVIE